MSTRKFEEPTRLSSLPPHTPDLQNSSLIDPPKFSLLNFTRQEQVSWPQPFLSMHKKIEQKQNGLLTLKQMLKQKNVQSLVIRLKLKRARSTSDFLKARLAHSGGSLPRVRTFLGESSDEGYLRLSQVLYSQMQQTQARQQVLKPQAHLKKIRRSDREEHQAQKQQLEQIRAKEEVLNKEIQRYEAMLADYRRELQNNRISSIDRLKALAHGLTITVADSALLQRKKYHESLAGRIRQIRQRREELIGKKSSSIKGWAGESQQMNPRRIEQQIQRQEGQINRLNKREGQIAQMLTHLAPFLRRAGELSNLNEAECQRLAALLES